MRIIKPVGKHFSIHKISRTRVQVVLHSGAARHCPLSQTVQFDCYQGDVDITDYQLALQAKKLERSGS